jgi:ADP-heptose:LPS heptosyltransferase
MTPPPQQSGGPVHWSQVSRLLVLRMDNIGDVILLAPGLRALRETLPGAEITLMASPAGRQAAPLLPWVDERSAACAS